MIGWDFDAYCTDSPSLLALDKVVIPCYFLGIVREISVMYSPTKVYLKNNVMALYLLKTSSKLVLCITLYLIKAQTIKKFSDGYCRLFANIMKCFSFNCKKISTASNINDSHALMT